MPSFGASSDLQKRIAKLESAALAPQHQKAVFWAIQGPHNMPEGAAVAFLRECGHDVRDEDHNIIRIVIGAKDGRPVDLPLKDLTAQCRPAASALHMQHDRG